MRVQGIFASAAEESGCDQKANCLRPGGLRFQAPIHRTDGEQLGFTEAAAKDFSIGFYRGQIYIPIRHTDGSISGFVGYADGQMNLPPKWLPATSNVVTFFQEECVKKAPRTCGAFFC